MQAASELKEFMKVWMTTFFILGLTFGAETTTPDKQDVKDSTTDTQTSSGQVTNGVPTEVPPKQAEKKEESYFRKNLIAIIALGISILLGGFNIWWTTRNNNLQNARWSVINEPRFEIYPGRFYIFATLTEDELNKKQWYPGYKPTIYPHYEGFAHTGKFVVYSDIVFINDKENKLVYGKKIMQTEEHVKSELGTAGLQGLRVLKRHRLRFAFRNLSQGSPKNLVAKWSLISGTSGIGEKQARMSEVSTATPQYTETPNLYYFEFDMVVVPEAGFNQVERYRISLEYEFEGQKKSTPEQWFEYHHDQDRWEGPYDRYLWCNRTEPCSKKND